MEAFIKGNPKPQPRPRACLRGRRAGIYNPPSADEWKAKIAAGMVKYANMDFQRPFMLFLTFYMKRPLSHYGTGRNAHKIKASAPEYHLQTPDIDNLTKAVMDAITVLNVWRDDSQVISLTACKVWSDCRDEAGVNIAIEPAD